MNKENPQIIEELAYYLRHWVERAVPEMPATDPDNIIGRFVWVCIFDDSHEEEWERNPQVGAIGSLAGDMEIQNGDMDEMWQEIKSRVTILDAYVNRYFLNECDREEITSFTSPVEIADYWQGLSKEDNFNLTKHMINVVGNKHFRDWYYQDSLLATTFDLLCDVDVSHGRYWQEARRRITIFCAFSHNNFLYEYDRERIAALQSVAKLLDFWDELCPTEIDFADPNLAKLTMELAEHMINVVGNKHFQNWCKENVQLAVVFLRLCYIATGWDSPGMWRDIIRPMICDLKGEPQDSACKDVVYKNVSR